MASKLYYCGEEKMIIPSMMKYRSWNLLTKQFRKYDWEDICLEMVDFKILNEECIPPQKSTGLEDSEQTEIYEGDLLVNIGTGIIKMIYWDPECAAFQMDGLFMSHFNLNDYVVKGNICENKNLLNKKDLQILRSLECMR